MDERDYKAMNKGLKPLTLKEKIEEIWNDLMDEFEQKQDLEFTYWVADEVGGIACFIDTYFFNASDITLDLFTSQPKGLIMQWQNECIENPINNINYKSYTMGLRFQGLKK